MLVNYKKANNIFFYDNENIKKLIESKFINLNQIPISFYDDKILFYNTKDGKLFFQDYKIEKIDENLILTLSKKDYIMLENIDTKKYVNDYAKGIINEAELIDLISDEIKEKHIFYENIKNKIYEKSYMNKIDFELIFDVIKNDSEVKKILENNKDKLNELTKQLYEYIKDSEIIYSDNVFYIPENKDEIKILLSGNLKTYIKIDESVKYRNKVVKILKQLKNYESLFKNKEFLELFEKENYKKLLEKFNILKFLPKDELKSLLEKTMIKLKKKNISESIENKILPTFNKLIEADEETQEFKNYVKDLNKKEKEEIEKEVEKESEPSEEDKEKNLDVLNQELIKQLKDIFEKIKEYVDDETPSMEYIERVLNFLNGIEQNQKKVDAAELQNVLYILNGGQEIHPAIKNNFPEKEKPEEKEEEKKEEEKPEEKKE